MINDLLPLFQNKIIQSVFLSFFIASSLKPVFNWFKSKRFDISLFFKSGHMPSSHTAIVVALSTSLFHETGISTLFIVTLIFSFIVIYDAVGVRRAAGKQAEVINKIIGEFHINKKIKSEHLYEFIGHTPTEVIVGGILGFIITYIIYLI
ncbi:divergent PAP2 family protein [Candidatus Woesearchaeota archaeon]|nr:divergent PAP2 family protein [Candidatus Woesearchaeota archaeon]